MFIWNTRRVSLLQTLRGSMMIRDWQKQGQGDRTVNIQRVLTAIGRKGHRGPGIEKDWERMSLKGMKWIYGSINPKDRWESRKTHTYKPLPLLA